MATGTEEDAGTEEAGPEEEAGTEEAGAEDDDEAGTAVDVTRVVGVAVTVPPVVRKTPPGGELEELVSFDVVTGMTVKMSRVEELLPPIVTVLVIRVVDVLG